MNDTLAEVIARVRKIVGRYHKDDNVISVDRPDLNAILDAAEAGMRATDAALEEKP